MEQFDLVYHKLLSEFFKKTPTLNTSINKYSRDGQLKLLRKFFKKYFEDLNLLPADEDLLKLPSISTLHNFYDSENQTLPTLERLVAIRDYIYSNTEEEKTEILEYIRIITRITEIAPRWEKYKELAMVEIEKTSTSAKDLKNPVLPEFAIFYACHQYSPKKDTQEFKVSHLQITARSDENKWDTASYISFEDKNGKLENKTPRLGKFSHGYKTFYFNSAHGWNPETTPLYKADRQTHMIFSSSGINPDKTGFLAGTFIAKAENDSPLAGVFIAKKVSSIEDTKEYYESLRKGKDNDPKLKEITSQLRNRLISVSNALPNEISELNDPGKKISTIVGTLEKKQVDLEGITKDGGEYICLRTSSDGRFIHFYPLCINRKGIVVSTELDTTKKPTAQQHETRNFWGIIDSFDENKFSIELGIETTHPFRYMFEREGEQNEYRGFCLGFEFGNTNKPSATRCMLLPVELYPRLLDICPLDIEVNSDAFMNLPLTDENKYLPMRLGGVYDNAMRFFDAAENNKSTGPDIKLGDVFYYAAKGIIAEKTPSIKDYQLCVKYLIESEEHAFEGNFGSRINRSKDFKLFIKEIEDKVDFTYKSILSSTEGKELKTEIERLKGKLNEGIKFRFAKSAPVKEKEFVKILKEAFTK